MRKRLLLLFGVLGLLAVGAGLVVVLLTPERSITWENCERILPGMTEAEVEQLLGRPADACLPGDSNVTYWRFGPAGSIRVAFDRSSQVGAADFSEILTLEKPSPLYRLRSWLGL